ncbi:hypothetical protein DPMN_126633 [Dreissena polymorpha]|uniref:Uncharacterized protein n=1 Tax=Dreissena polymorpha TaxID=45954 RepID=A0A9D4JU47_DREPO|nr:hypothetical protein DPMN_126633 [Dreissena polymorpha]
MMWRFWRRNRLKICQKRKPLQDIDAAAASVNQCSVNMEHELETSDFHNVTYADSPAGPNVNISYSCTEPDMQPIR